MKRHKGNFRVSATRSRARCSTSSRQWAPDVLDLFKELADTGCCEFIGETYYHSLSFLYSKRRVRGPGRHAHARKIQRALRADARASSGTPS
ncbi:MAG: hypothetical protein V9E83_03620 [Baekduia sp.]